MAAIAGRTGARVELRGLGKSFVRPGAASAEVLRNINLCIASGESLAIVGPSGSGKSTLLALIAGLDRPSSGVVIVDEVDLAQCDERRAAELRLRTIGLIFQAHHLLPQCSALENVLLPTLAGPQPRSASDARARAMELLQQVGLAARAEQRPGNLSGGECQRVALARALMLRPRLILADEPTGSLDAGNAQAVGELLLEQCRSAGATLIVVTHSDQLAQRMQRVCELRAGELTEVQRTR